MTASDGIVLRLAYLLEAGGRADDSGNHDARRGLYLGTYPVPASSPTTGGRSIASSPT
jgi:hypothetical protein